MYLTASATGLFPTQVINCYLGSTLRSMEDVLTDDSTASTGYLVFAVQVGHSFFKSHRFKFIIKLLYRTKILLTTIMVAQVCV
jgi:hypothetical protein